MTDQIKLRPDNPCPCGKGKLLRDCCLTPTGHLRKQVPTLAPPLPITGRAHDGCYLKSTMDCSPDITAEHYMSRSVLEALESIGGAVRIGGAPWLPKGEHKIVGINNLTAKILCDRHNSSLSPLDAEAGEFAKSLQRTFIDLERRYLSQKTKLILISGELLELWMLKVACGLFYSKNAARNGARMIDDHTLDSKLVVDALLEGKWADRCGLYMRAPTGHRITVENSVAMIPLSAAGEKRILGAQVNAIGLEFVILFDPQGINIGSFTREGWQLRPSELSFRNETLSRSIGLTWPPGTPKRSIRMIGL